MFKIYSKDDKLILLPYDETPYDGLIFVGETCEPDYLKLASNARIQWIKEELERLDFKSIRPLREGNLAMVQEIETQAEALRVELRALLAA